MEVITATMPIGVHEQEAICVADPLHADELLREVPLLNLREDVMGLLDLLKELTNRAFMVPMSDPAAMHAAVRDLGLVMGSIKRHGMEPVAQVPNLQEWLFAYGKEYNMVPRDTIYHYSHWNPKGRRRRVYTHFMDEANLVDAVAGCVPGVELAIATMLRMNALEAGSHEFNALLPNLINGINSLAEMTVQAWQTVAPAIFGSHLRHFYDPVKVGREPFLGPGAVEIPVYVIDHLLWSSMGEYSEHEHFKATYLPYAVPKLRDAFHTATAKPSILERVEAAAKHNPTPGTEEARQGIALAMQRLVDFRTPHYRLAIKAYTENEEAVRAHGSGGTGPEMLMDILNLTARVRRRLLDA